MRSEQREGGAAVVIQEVPEVARSVARSEWGLPESELLIGYATPAKASV